MSWKQYYLFRLSHEIVTIEYPGIKAEVTINKNSPYMMNLLNRLKIYVNQNRMNFKLKDDDKILSILARTVALKFSPGDDETNDDEDLNRIYFDELVGMDNDSVFDLTQNDIEEYRREIASQQPQPQQPQPPQQLHQQHQPPQLIYYAQHNPPQPIYYAPRYNPPQYPPRRY